MQALERITYTNNWVTILLLFLLMSIALLKLLDTQKLKESFFALLNFSFIEDEDVEKTSFFNTFQILLFLFSTTVFSLVLYNFKLYKIQEAKSDFNSFLTVFVGLLMYFLLKKMLEHALSLLFLIKKHVKFFIISKTNYLYSISFLLYITLVLCEYANINQVYIFFFTLFLFAMRFVFSAIANKKLIFNKLFYFILYICAFEIAPLFVLFKLMF